MSQWTIDTFPNADNLQTFTEYVRKRNKFEFIESTLIVINMGLEKRPKMISNSFDTKDQVDVDNIPLGLINS